MDKIESREFTYCSAVYQEPLTFRKFLVMTPSLPEARKRAHAFAAARWGEPHHVYYYPRTYVKQARELYALGQHD
jgi:hypothetical protein